MATPVFLSPIANDASFTNSGVPASGYFLFTFQAGTTIHQVTYQDSAGTVQNSNPLVLNSQGYVSSGGNVVEVWIPQGVAVKFVLSKFATDPPNSVEWSRDSISGIN